tara:strand:+ start:105 stop:1421 length:1317 start_codon:yes stop_codon:yes gene_type:complete
MVTDTAGITSSLQTVQDGLGAGSSALKLSTTVVSVDGSLGVGTDSITAGYALDIEGQTYSRGSGASAAAHINLALLNNANDNSFYISNIGGAGTSKLSLNDQVYIEESTGNVGIGGVPTSSLLELHSASSEDAIKIVDSTNSYATTIGQGDSYTNLFGDSSNTGMLLGFGTPTTGNAKVTITAAGDVGIGTNAPDFPLEVAGDIGIDEKIYHNDDHNTYLQLTSDKFTVRTGGTDRLHISADGFVGIGDDAPGRPFVVSSSQNIISSLESTDADVYITLSDNGSTLTSSQRIGVTGDDMHFWTDSVERMRIDALGNVGIGVVEPTQKIDVVDTNPTDGIIARLYNISGSGLTGSKLWFAQNTVANWNIGQPAGTNAFVICNSTGSASERMRIDALGNVAIANTDSAPSAPSSGGILYVEAGALKYIGSSGTVTTLGAA